MRSRKGTTCVDGAGVMAGERVEETSVGRWTAEEHAAFEEGLKKHGKAWKRIAEDIPTRTVVQIRTHAQKYFLKLAKSEPNTSTSIALRNSVAEEEPITQPKQRRSSRKRRAMYEEDEWEEDSHGSHTSDEASQEDEDMYKSLRGVAHAAPHGAGMRTGHHHGMAGPRMTPAHLGVHHAATTSSLTNRLTHGQQMLSYSAAPPPLMIKIPSCGSDAELPTLLPPGHACDGKHLPKLMESIHATTTPTNGCTVPQDSPTSITDLCTTLQSFFPEAGYARQQAASMVDPAPSIMPLPPLLSGRGASEWCDPLAVLDETAVVSAAASACAVQQPSIYTTSNAWHQPAAATYTTHTHMLRQQSQSVPAFSPSVTYGVPSHTDSDITVASACTSYLSASSSEGDLYARGTVSPEVSCGYVECYQQPQQDLHQMQYLQQQQQRQQQMATNMQMTHVPQVYIQQQQQGPAWAVGGPWPAKRARVGGDMIKTEYGYLMPANPPAPTITPAAATRGHAKGTEEEDEEAYGFFVQTDDPTNMDNDQVMDEVIRLLWDAEAEDDTVMQDVMSRPELTNNTNTVYGVNVA